jgi:glycine/D-amino acid oxidase-like deaminating enzyme
MAALPDRVKYLVIGAGVHGLSTAWHLAKEQRSRGEEPDVLIVDKTGIGAGASGIACGVVRNNYFQPAMSELMAANVEVWEQDPPGFSYHPVGYVALGCSTQVSDLTAVYERQQRIGYPSELIVGAEKVRSHMKEMFPDWRAQGVEVCLHEEKGGYANNMASMEGLAKKAQEAGARLVAGVRVTGFDMDDSGAVKTVHTDQGDIAVEQVAIGVGPWIASLWEMLGLSDRIDVRTPEGDVHENQEMWTYWYLQEGEIAVDPKLLSLPDGSMPPVLHVDSDAPLYDDDGKLITDELWGNYFKQDLHGVQGGAAPIIVGHEFEVDPYPTASVDSSFSDMWCASLSHCMERFEGKRGTYKNVRSGGVGCFTADSFPIFDYMRPNVYVIADSNHGYKMIGVGREVAQVMTGGHSTVLYPFRFERFATGDLHPVSNSPYPWS